TNSRPVASVDAASLDITEGVLRDHDSRVDQHADGDGDSRQAHDVRRDACVIHRQERQQHRQWQWQRDDEDRSEVHQEDDVRERHERDFLDQRAPQRVDRLRDERRPVVERHDSDTRRQAGCNLVDARLDRLDYLLRVGAASHHHDAAHRFVVALDERCNTKRIAHMYLANLAHIYGNATRCRDDDVLEIADRFNQPYSAHDGPGAVGFQYVAADVLVAVAHRLDDVAERQVVGAKARRIDVDLVLLYMSADGRDFGDTRNSIQLVADEPVLQRPQIAQRVVVAFDGVPKDVADAGRIGSKRRECAFRHLSGNEAQTFQDTTAREGLVAVVLEQHVNH